MNLEKLKEQIQHELSEICQCSNEIERDTPLLKSSLEPVEKRRLAKAIGVDLHGFYTGTERAFEVIALNLDQKVPVGSEWHKKLLNQMTAEIPGVRQPVISQSTFFDLNDLRAFRHVMRSHYGHKLKPELVYKLAIKVSGCYKNLAQDLQSFLQSLERESEHQE